MPIKRKAKGTGPERSAERHGKKKKQKVSGDKFDQLLDAGEAKLNAVKFEEALELYTQALQLRPDHVATLDILAELCIGLGRIDEAHQYLKKSAEVAPDDVHVKYMYLAQMAENKDALGLYEKGLAILRKQLVECDDDEEKVDLVYDICSACCSIAELYLTDLCFEEDAEEQCEKWVEECKKVDEGFPEMYQVLGSLRISQHRTDEAKEALRKAVDLEMSAEGDTLGERMPSVESQAELCKLLFEVNDFKYCKRLLYSLLNIDDQNPYLWYLLGQCYKEQSHPTTAFKCFTRAKKHCKQDSELQEILKDTDACLQQLHSESTEALNGVNGDDDLTSDEDEDEEDGEEGDEEEEEQESLKEEV